MKSRIWNWTLFAVLLSGLGLAGAAESKGKSLEGTWRAQVTLRDCHSGAEIRTFPALLTFGFAGSLVETTTAFPPPLRSNGLGFWQHTDGSNYRAVSEAFLFNSAGIWTGTQRLTQTIQILDDPDEFESDAINEIFDPLGNLLVTGCATAIAHPVE